MFISVFLFLAKVWSLSALPSEALAKEGTKVKLFCCALSSSARSEEVALVREIYWVFWKRGFLCQGIEP